MKILAILVFQVSVVRQKTRITESYSFYKLTFVNCRFALDNPDIIFGGKITLKFALTI